MIRYALLLCVLAASQRFAFAQQLMDVPDFYKFAGKTYVVTPELETSCELMYAIVKVNTDSSDKIIGYDFVNSPSQAVKDGFKNILGYKFSKDLNIKQRPVFFFFLVDNHQICIEKKDLNFCSVDSISSILINNMVKILKENPNCIILQSTVSRIVGMTQR